MRRLLLALCMTGLLLAPCAVGSEDVTPKSAVAGATLAITGPEGSVAPGQDAWLKIDGLTLDEIKAAKSAQLFDLTVFPLKNVRVHATYDWLNDELELMFRAQEPAEYLVKLHLVRDGKLEVAAIVVVVEGDQPDPKPDPDPDPEPDPKPGPGQKWQVMLFHESDDLDDLPMAQRELIAGRAFREELESKGHRFMGGFDPDTLVTVKRVCNGKGCVEVPSVAPGMQAWWDAVKGDPLPRLAIAPIDGGAILDYPLPAGRAELYQLLEGSK